MIITLVFSFFFFFAHFIQWEEKIWCYYIIKSTQTVLATIFIIFLEWKQPEVRKAKSSKLYQQGI